MRWFVLAMATLSLAACLSYSSSPSPTVVVPPGSTVVCPNGTVYFERIGSGCRERDDARHVAGWPRPQCENGICTAGS